MNSCPQCNSSVKKNGKCLRNNIIHQRYYCKQCSSNHYESVSNSIEQQVEIEEFVDLISKVEYRRSDEWVSKKLESSKYVITSAQSDTKVNTVFLNSLKTYCEYNNAELLIIPVKYRNPTMPNEIEYDIYDESIQEYLFENNIRLHPKLKVLGALKIAATAEYPLSSLGPLSKGDSVIIGHNQLQLTTLPVSQDDYPVIMTTTGSVTDSNFSLSKAGMKAEFNHSLSAAVIELDDDIFHLRHLNFDGTGFYDLDTYYSSEGYFSNTQIDLIVTGDEHAIHMDPNVKEATYGNNGIVDSLKPKMIVRHDVCDFESGSHHDNRNILKKFKKHIKGTDLVHEELIATAMHILDTSPPDTQNIIVASNHNEHLIRWLNETKIEHCPQNALIYHKLMFEMLFAISEDREVEPFNWFVTELIGDQCDIKFLNRTESFKIHNIELGYHGDVGPNGSRGSRDALSKLPSKTIIGHSHSPGISGGCYQVGTSGDLKMDYCRGPSSWMHSHVIVHKNGKRQLVNIIRGKWRL